MVQGLILTVIIFGCLFFSGFILGAMITDRKATKHSVKGTFTIKELDDAPGFGKLHIELVENIDKDSTDKIILCRNDSPE